MALYGVSVFFILLIFLSAYIHYHFGLNFGVFFLLIITILYLLLGLVTAMLLVVFSTTCPNVEPVAIAVVPDKLKPVLR
jgi:hypothetical protein